MKRFLFFCLILTTIFVQLSPESFATSLDSQSIDVRVGEVDQINTQNERQKINSPSTGLFGLGSGEESITATFLFAISFTCALVFFFRYKKHQHQNK